MSAPAPGASDASPLYNNPMAAADSAAPQAPFGSEGKALKKSEIEKEVSKNF